VSITNNGPNTFSLIYFTANPIKAKSAFDAGVDAVLVDCENNGKEKGQTGYNTEINYHKPIDIAKVRDVNPKGRIFCRVNSAKTTSNFEDINMAINSGAEGIVLPLVESKEDIEKTNEIINKRALLIAMIETEAGYQNIEEIVQSEIDAVYVGLNDFSISRQGAPLFEPLIDGTIQQIITKCNVPVGVGGVTAPQAGWPIKSQTIIQEYQRLGVKFSILRRSFEEAIKLQPIEEVVTEIRKAYDHASLRNLEKIEDDSDLFEASIYNKRLVTANE
jgi:2-keto-3-deoxy-L-rhamnonate aldolase RhmA